jgi:serine/threonine-protein kinase RsbT
MAARDVARHLGFNKTDQARIATATSELARSIVLKAVEGTVTIGPIQRGNRSGIEVIVDDYSSGMPDVSALLQDGSQREQHTGPGLATSRRLMDELDIDTRLEQGTTVTCRKWLR